MTVQRMPINFLAKESTFTAKQLDARTCKNWYITVAPEGAKFKTPLFPFPGSRLWSEDSTQPEVRLLYDLNDVLYGVVGNEFRIYNDVGGYRKKGTLNTSFGRCYAIATKAQIMISDGKDGYVYQLVKNTAHEKEDFYVIENATSFVSALTFAGSGTDDLTITGNYAGGSSRSYKVQIDGSSSSYISNTTYTGQGKDDLNTSGSFTGLRTLVYTVQIDSVSGAADKFRWKNNEDVDWVATGVVITGNNQLLEEGVNVRFDSTTEHDTSDTWTFTAYPADTADTFRWSDTNGASWNAEHIRITGGVQTLNYGLEASFLHVGGHTKEDFWTFDTTTDSAFYAPLIPEYLDGYAAYSKQNDNRFYLTSLDDVSVINALTYAEANYLPQNIVVVMAVNGELLFFCKNTIVFWNDVGAADFPFRRRQNMLLNYGCVAPYSVAKGSNNIVFWLGRNENGGRVVLALESYTIKEISDEPLAQKLNAYSEVENAFGFVVEWTGHVFYFLTLPTEDVTWVYDLTTSSWFQRSSRYLPKNISSQEYVDGRYLANCHVYHRGMNLIGDYKSGNIYKLDASYYKDGDQPIICEATAPIIHNKLSRITVYMLHTDFEAATALTSGQGSEPAFMLQYSKDGGYSWSKELWRTAGKVGEFMKRAKWNKLGTGRNFVFRIRCSDPVYRVLIGAVAEMEADAYGK